MYYPLCDWWDLGRFGSDYDWSLCATRDCPTYHQWSHWRWPHCKSSRTTSTTNRELFHFRSTCTSVTVRVGLGVGESNYLICHCYEPQNHSNTPTAPPTGATASIESASELPNTRKFIINYILFWETLSKNRQEVTIIRINLRVWRKKWNFKKRKNRKNQNTE